MRLYFLWVGSSLKILNRLWAGIPENMNSVPSGSVDFSLYIAVHLGCEARPAFHAAGTGVRVKRLGVTLTVYFCIVQKELALYLRKAARAY
jgi:hypothetical protein